MSELPGMWEESDLSGGRADAENVRPGAWARLVNSDGSDEHLELCNEALKEVQAETERRVKARNVVLPVRGRYLVQDGKAYRVKDQWVQQQASDRIKLTVVIYKGSL